MGNIPTPLGLPFGYFPDTQEATSGILFPKYGDERRRGLFLKEGDIILLGMTTSILLQLLTSILKVVGQPLLGLCTGSAIATVDSSTLLIIKTLHPSTILID